MLFTTSEYFRIQFNLEIPKKCTFKSNISLKNYKNYFIIIYNIRNINIILVYKYMMKLKKI